MGNTSRFIAALILIACAGPAFADAPQTQAASQDDFLAGYASAVLEREFHIRPTTLSVKDRIITITKNDLGAAERENIRNSLMANGWAKDVLFDPPSMAPAAQTPNQPVLLPDGSVQTYLSAHPFTFLAPTSVFDPLLADPRWPQFSAAYVRYVGRAQANGVPQANGTLHTDRDAGNVSFGESLALVQWAPEPGGTLEIGVQASLFANFDLDLTRVDLINADYFVGPDVEYRHGDFSMLFRIYHQSSHLGDNFLEHDPKTSHPEVTFEKPDLLFSYDLLDKTLRLYGGGGYLVDVLPKSLRPGVVEYGIEYAAPSFFHELGAIPIAALDIQNRQQNHWSADFSARIGLQFQNPSTFGRKLDLMLEYYNGHSPNGQFYLQNIQSLGVGLHFFL